MAAPALVRADASPLAGKPVTFIVGGGVGNTFDNFGRTLARQFERQIPGLVVHVKNVEQASGLLSAKMLQEGPTDGTMLLTTSSSVFSAQLVGNAGVHFDVRQWGWLGKHGTETRVLLRGPGADFKTFEELRAKTAPTPMSVRAKTSHAYQEALWLNALLGLRINPVPGYAKSVDAETALIQGEVMLVPAGDPTDRTVMETDGVDVVLQISSGTLPARYQGRPLLRDLVGSGGPGRAQVLDFIDLTSNMVRWVAVPPNTPPELIAAWQEAFAKAAQAPEYAAESQKLNLVLEYTSGPEIAARVAAIFQTQTGLAADLDALERCGEALAAGEDSPCARS